MDVRKALPSVSPETTIMIFDMQASLLMPILGFTAFLQWDPMIIYSVLRLKKILKVSLLKLHLTMSCRANNSLQKVHVMKHIKKIESNTCPAIKDRCHGVNFHCCYNFPFLSNFLN